MSIAQMRNVLSRMYGPSWAGKVERMSDKQVAATYMRLLNATTTH